MPTAMLLDHSNTFTPLNQINKISVQQRQQSLEVNNADQNAENDMNRYLDEDSNDNRSDANDPYSAEEILRRKIEETNQKISDYFAQQ